MDEPKTIFALPAERNGVTPDEMRAKIAARIAEGLHDPDPSKRAEWKKIPHAGEVPTPEEYVRYLVEKLDAEGLGEVVN